jgi:DNA-binding MarR family transcriptional regulator
MRKPYYTLESLEADASVGYLLRRCGMLMTQVVRRRFQLLPVSHSQWVVLIQLAQQQHISPTRLSAQVGHDMGALTRVVDELERLGFVRRERNRRDRRAVEIAISPAGRREAQSAKRVVAELLNRLIEPFTDREIDTLLALLKRLRGHLQEVLTPKAAAAPARMVAALDRPLRRRRKSANGGAA